MAMKTILCNRLAVWVSHGHRAFSLLAPSLRSLCLLSLLSFFLWCPFLLTHVSFTSMVRSGHHVSQAAKKIVFELANRGRATTTHTASLSSPVLRRLLRRLHHPTAALSHLLAPIPLQWRP
ncbi:hypothetical protein F5148DRAFT_222540 [Russula earlei]|uniref:Uncharacterized protein n=1 Tax=Russula earlei TaxID=71964 RepID=A0ACC0U4H5_9AGAM|nr:hypothetical protein F5148DRAFT_222540 [Russula earlei]